MTEEKLKEAYEEACSVITDLTGSCPFEVYDWNGCKDDKCDDNSKECWMKYFEDVTND